MCEIAICSKKTFQVTNAQPESDAPFRSLHYEASNSYYPEERECIVEIVLFSH